MTSDLNVGWKADAILIPDLSD